MKFTIAKGLMNMHNRSHAFLWFNMIQKLEVGVEIPFDVYLLSVAFECSVM